MDDRSRERLPSSIGVGQREGVEGKKGRKGTSDLCVRHCFTKQLHWSRYPSRRICASMITLNGGKER